jgi:hypothetical protein
MENLTGIGPGGHQRMQTQHPGVPVGGALLGITMHLADRRVEIHRHGPVCRSGPGGPGPGEDLGAQLIELADMTEGETAQERPTRRSRHGLMPEHHLGGTGPQDLDIVNAVAVRHDGLSQAQDLPSRPGRSRSIAQIDKSVGQRLDTQTLGDYGGQHQPGVRHRMIIVGHHVEAARTARS